jgi:hypothetical protein
MSKILRIRKNKHGTDYWIGDIHGCYSLLEEALLKIGFDKTKDRLFVLGDLIDRGPESYLAAEYLQHPWFIALQGNHDAFVYHTAKALLDESAGKSFVSRDDQDVSTCLGNGGSWILMQTDSTLAEIVDQFSFLPLLIEYQDDDGTPLLGMVHAEVSPDTSWKEIVNAVEKLPDDFVYSLRLGEHSLIGTTVWGRAKYKTSKRTPEESRSKSLKNSLKTPGIPLLVCGHNVVSDKIHDGPYRIENNRLIDHGICKGGGVRIYTYEELK